MSGFQKNCNPLAKNEVLDKSLDLHMRSYQAKSWLKWGIINFLALIILSWDMSRRDVKSKLYYVEYTFIVILGINLISYFLKYLLHIFTFDPVKGTKEQKKLLKFDDSDTSFIVNDPSKTFQNSDQAVPMNATILSWHSSFNNSNRSIGSSWLCNRSGTSPKLNQSLGISTSESQNVSWNTSYNSSFNANYIGGAGSISPNTSFNSPYRKYLKDEIITEEKPLKKYLKEVLKKEHNISGPHGAQTTFNTQSINSFWNYCNTAANLLKTSLYQLSPSQTTVSPIKQGAGGSGKIVEGDFEGVLEILKQISPAKLSQYVANLRMWISITILQRLEREIMNIDESLRLRGFSDLQIGSVGLERLKKTAENQQLVSLHVPMLPLIVPFLEMSTNQEYLVQRIKDLSKGSCIADYRWDSGSSYHGLNWDEHLPTDSAILFHLFCTYLDCQLMPLPQPGGRPFFTRYVIIGDKKSAKDTLSEAQTKNKTKCAILCTNQLKPKFNFISDNKIHNCPYDRNNLFYVIIQFLFYMKKHHGGLLEGVNLGKSGINILCVIED